MKTVELADASEQFSAYAQQARREPVIVTRNGRPYVALTSMGHTDWENLVVSNDPRFIAMIERSRATCPPGSGISSDEMRRLLGVSPKSVRGPARPRIKAKRRVTGGKGSRRVPR